MQRTEVTNGEPSVSDKEDAAGATVRVEAQPLQRQRPPQRSPGPEASDTHPGPSNAAGDSNLTHTTNSSSDSALASVSMSLALSMSPSQSLERVRRCQTQVVNSLERYSMESQERRGSSESPAGRLRSPRQEAGCGPSLSELGSLSPLSPLSDAIRAARCEAPLC
jgi:hypothetical protein